VTVAVLLAGTVAALVGSVPTDGQLALAAIVIVALIWLLLRYARWYSTNFVLTTDRVVHRSGIIAKRGREIPLDHINDISYNQTVFGRIIGAGSLTIESAGQRGQELFPDLPRPSRIQNEMYKQIEGGKTRLADRMAGGRQLSIPEQIEKLDELRRRGVLSEAEFETSKADLLNRL
jgi:membrane protein YdbS with pleckstrin-like domain